MSKQKLGVPCPMCGAEIDVIENSFTCSQTSNPIVECQRCKAIYLVTQISCSLEYMGSEVGEMN